MRAQSIPALPHAWSTGGAQEWFTGWAGAVQAPPFVARTCDGSRIRNRQYSSSLAAGVSVCTWSVSSTRSTSSRYSIGILDRDTRSGYSIGILDRDTRSALDPHPICTRWPPPRTAAPVQRSQAPCRRSMPLVPAKRAGATAATSSKTTSSPPRTAPMEQPAPMARPTSTVSTATATACPLPGRRCLSPVRPDRHGGCISADATSIHLANKHPHLWHSAQSHSCHIASATVPPAPLAKPSATLRFHRWQPQDPIARTTASAPIAQTALLPLAEPIAFGRHPRRSGQPDCCAAFQSMIVHAVLGIAPPCARGSLVHRPPSRSWGGSACHSPYPTAVFPFHRPHGRSLSHRPALSRGCGLRDVA
ncbi:uncharacterized protein BJ171DRAFT_168769 [Polychytrium aggregatum]|uniref:uncharacterized protein n=1 Tax=Polychytrium aggregatum TaxID=110093 RepID=UPI0022FF4594|nr:uncharacterized protein BJ171DRAFT_168769 [Polychytrium aggregatum]KAI9208811.1 hypothetical protein BJ171DRAFT_168769 [Polychytrium aggregatum]